MHTLEYGLYGLLCTMERGVGKPEQWRRDLAKLMGVAASYYVPSNEVAERAADRAVQPMRRRFDRVIHGK
jgi:hypothetical protein